jgi:hypothetical protein
MTTTTTPSAARHSGIRPDPGRHPALHKPASCPAARRRSDAGSAQFTSRDIAGMVLAGDMYGTPYDLPAPRGAALYRPRSGQRWEEFISGSDG